MPDTEATLYLVLPVSKTAELREDAQRYTINSGGHYHPALTHQAGDVAVL